MRKRLSSLTIDQLVVWNAFFRAFVLTFGSIYMSAIFILKVGKESWPLVLLYAQLFALVFVAATNYIKNKTYTLINKFIILAGVIALGLFASDTESKVFITMLVVMTFVMDLIGEIVATNIVSRCMTSLAYKANSSKSGAAVLIANVFASLGLIAVQKLGNESVFCGILAGMIAIHFLLTHEMGNRPAILVKGLHSKVKIDLSAKDRLAEVLDYCRQSPLILLIFALFIWTQSAKFFSDWLYMSSSSTVFPEEDQLAVFLSIANIVMMLSAFFFQKLYAQKIMMRFAPGTLIGIIPMSFLLISILGVLLKWPIFGICLNLFFILAHKTIHMPSLKITLHSVAPRFRSRVILVMTFCVSVALLILSMFMRSLKAWFNNDQLYFALIIMGVLGLILVMQFEGPYLQNLWKNLVGKEDLNEELGYNPVTVETITFNPHHFFTDFYSRPIASDIRDYLDVLIAYPKADSTGEFLDYFYRDSRTSFERFLLVLNVYIYGKNLRLFKEAMTAHKYMLNSQSLREYGIKLLILGETPEFRQELRKIEETDDYAKKMRLISERLDEASTENSDVHKRLKIFGLLSWEYLTGQNQEMLLTVLRSPYSPGLRQLGKFLSDPEIGQIKHDLLKSWSSERGQLNVIELVRRYFLSETLKRRQFQKVFLGLILPEADLAEVKSLMRKHIDLVKNSLTVTERLELLFLREWTTLRTLKYSYVLESISEYAALSADDRKYWKDFHLEYLKKGNSRWFSRMVREDL